MYVCVCMHTCVKGVHECVWVHVEAGGQPLMSLLRNTVRLGLRQSVSFTYAK